MTMGEVRAWAMANGFSRMDEDTVAYDLGHATCEIAFLSRAVRMTMALPDGTVVRRVTANPSRLRLGAHGVLEGLGLSASLATARPPPPWLASYLAGTAEEADAAEAPRVPF